MVRSYMNEVYGKGYWKGYCGPDAGPITFTGKQHKLTCCGEGGNRHIYVSDSEGTIDIYVDSHIFDGTHAVFIWPLKVHCGNPSAQLLLDIQGILTYEANKIEHGTLYFAKEAMDKAFKRLYNKFVKPIWHTSKPSYRGWFFIKTKDR